MPILSLLIVFAGFMITRSHMGWLLFVHYIDIYGYLFRALAQNEFLADRFQIFPNGPNQPSLGQQYLIMFDQQTDPVWVRVHISLVLASVQVPLS